MPVKSAPTAVLAKNAMSVKELSVQLAPTAKHVLPSTAPPVKERIAKNVMLSIVKTVKSATRSDVSHAQRMAAAENARLPSATDVLDLVNAKIAVKNSATTAKAVMNAKLSSVPHVLAENVKSATFSSVKNVQAAKRVPI